MGKNVRFRWNRGVHRQIRTMPEVMDELERRIERGLVAANTRVWTGGPVRETGGRGRGRGAIIAGGPNSLLRALNGMRD